MSTQNRWNPKGIKRNHRGQLVDRWGRIRETDWEKFRKLRKHRKNPLLCST